jgi:hypothetical protein
MHTWIDLSAVLKILIFALVLGAALPALFALGVRFNAQGAGVTGDAGTAHRNPALSALGWLIFAVVVVAVIIGILFIARDFVAAHTGWYILGAQHPKGK